MLSKMINLQLKTNKILSPLQSYSNNPENLLLIPLPNECKTLYLVLAKHYCPIVIFASAIKSCV